MDTGFAIMTDCFAYDKQGKRCKALDDLYCKKQARCNFYKTRCDVKIKSKPKRSQSIDKTRTSSSGVRFY